MNKNELIAEYSTKNNVGKSDATKAVESLFDIMEDEVENNLIKRANIGKAMNMTPNEKTNSFGQLSPLVFLATIF